LIYTAPYTCYLAAFTLKQVHIFKFTLYKYTKTQENLNNSIICLRHHQNRKEFSQEKF